MHVRLFTRLFVHRVSTLEICMRSSLFARITQITLGSMLPVCSWSRRLPESTRCREMQESVMLLESFSANTAIHASQARPTPQPQQKVTERWSPLISVSSANASTNSQINSRQSHTTACRVQTFEANTRRCRGKQSTTTCIYASLSSPFSETPATSFLDYMYHSKWPINQSDI